ncbi:hypothetical protein LEP1GSC103_0972 [Leptospira borgpetersenii serovar Javanica str. UI 09931]|uniref:Lipoprotein n=1 Tax=Leptospira borgpetersenii serovar Javanica str. UI 09931 TaxID=1049767 RepID=A0AAV3JG35_LEPBO|nr:hypothetical protein LEP1GSC103_0972 [Leptospira borgpetersenii serovar Javanica str. UI 09931]
MVLFVPSVSVQPHACGEKAKNLYRINPDFLQSIFGFCVRVNL